MTYHNKTFLVTGAAGFIGSHLVDALLAEGAVVLGVDNLLTGQEKNLTAALQDKNFTFIEADVIQSPQSYLPENFIPDVIFHMASPASPPRYQANPIETYLVNSMGTHNLLQFLLEQNPEGRFIFASTSECYGNPFEHPQKETYWGNVNPNGIRSCYDEAKRFGETVCGVHTRDFFIDTRIIRIFNTYGPRMDLDDGRVIPNFFTQALKNEPITVYGKGVQTRSLCFVSDLVEGLLKLASEDNAAGETINIGNPEELTMLELATKIIHVTGSKSEIIFKDLPKDDPEKRKPDITKAKELLEWEPKIYLEEGLQKTLSYFQKELIV